MVITVAESPAGAELLPALFAWPEVRDYARINHNPSSLPHNYAANLGGVVAVVLVVTVGAVWLARRRMQ